MSMYYTLFIVFWDLFVLLNLGAVELFFVLSNTKSEKLNIFKSQVLFQILKQRNHANDIWITCSFKL
jgi:hypothetical protein